jgi:hypothetical protein
LQSLLYQLVKKQFGATPFAVAHAAAAKQDAKDDNRE